MEWVTTNLDFSLKPHPAAYRWRLERFPTFTRLAISWSNVICLIPGLNIGRQQPKSHDSQNSPWYLSREWMSGELSLKKMLGSYIKLTQKLNSPCTFSITTTIVVAVSWSILLCSSWSNVPTLTPQMQPDSISSISYSIEHLAHRKPQYKLPWWMFWKRSCHHFLGANMVHRQSFPLNDVIMWQTALAAGT
jgi:hypothetical protein